MFWSSAFPSIPSIHRTTSPKGTASFHISCFFSLFFPAPPSPSASSLGCCISFPSVPFSNCSHTLLLLPLGAVDLSSWTFWHHGYLSQGDASEGARWRCRPEGDCHSPSSSYNGIRQKWINKYMNHMADIDMCLSISHLGICLKEEI